MVGLGEKSCDKRYIDIVRDMYESTLNAIRSPIGKTSKFQSH